MNRLFWSLIFGAFVLAYGVSEIQAWSIALEKPEDSAIEDTDGNNNIDDDEDQNDDDDTDQDEDEDNEIEEKEDKLDNEEKISPKRQARDSWTAYADCLETQNKGFYIACYPPLD